MMGPIRILLTAGALMLCATELGAGALAVIVNRENTLEEIGAPELRAIFRGETQFWGDGTKIRLVVSPPDRPEGRKFNASVYGMTGDELKKYWIRKVFRGDVGVPPKVLPTDAEIIGCVGSTRSAVGFVDAANVDETVRALRIDGRAPGEPGYLLE
jgi:ABC-type phosphate transport system substrate-binding protein